MSLTDQLTLNRKSGGAQRRDLLFYRNARSKQMLEYATDPHIPIAEVFSLPRLFRVA